MTKSPDTCDYTVCLFQRVLVANTDFVVGRIRSRLDVVNYADLQSKRQTCLDDEFLYFSFI